MPAARTRKTTASTTTDSHDIGVAEKVGTTKNFVKYEVPNGDRGITYYIPTAAAEAIGNPDSIVVSIRVA